MTKEEEWTLSYLQRRNADLEAENELLRRRLNEFAISQHAERSSREQ
jgi:hypothetical protein